MDPGHIVPDNEGEGDAKDTRLDPARHVQHSQEPKTEHPTLFKSDPDQDSRDTRLEPRPENYGGVRGNHGGHAFLGEGGEESATGADAGELIFASGCLRVEGRDLRIPRMGEPDENAPPETARQEAGPGGINGIKGDFYTPGHEQYWKSGSEDRNADRRLQKESTVAEREDPDADLEGGDPGVERKVLRSRPIDSEICGSLTPRWAPLRKALEVQEEEMADEEVTGRYPLKRAESGVNLTALCSIR
jgi:hypothetical protein